MSKCGCEREREMATVARVLLARLPPIRRQSRYRGAEAEHCRYHHTYHSRTKEDPKHLQSSLSKTEFGWVCAGFSADNISRTCTWWYHYNKVRAPYYLSFAHITPVLPAHVTAPVVAVPERGKRTPALIACWWLFAFEPFPHHRAIGIVPQASSTNNRLLCHLCHFTIQQILYLPLDQQQQRRRQQDGAP